MDCDLAAGSGRKRKPRRWLARQGRKRWRAARAPADTFPKLLIQNAREFGEPPKLWHKDRSGHLADADLDARLAKVRDEKGSADSDKGRQATLYAMHR